MRPRFLCYRDRLSQTIKNIALRQFAEVQTFKNIVRVLAAHRRRQTSIPMGPDAHRPGACVEIRVHFHRHPSPHNGYDFE